MQKFYKTLTQGGIAPISGVAWSLPRYGQPGQWMPRVHEVVYCKSGYYFCRRKDLVYWLREEIYEVDPLGQIFRYDHKCAAHQARLIRKCPGWTPETARLLAADCAEHVLPIFETQCPNDDRPREAIAAARLFALETISEDEICATALAAHMAFCAESDRAVRAAVRAASLAASKAQTSLTAVNAAADASASSSSDYVAARKWQTTLLFQYLNRPVSESLQLAREKLETS